VLGKPEFPSGALFPAGTRIASDVASRVAGDVIYSGAPTQLMAPLDAAAAAVLTAMAAAGGGWQDAGGWVTAVGVPYATYSSG